MDSNNSDSIQGQTKFDNFVLHPYYIYLLFKTGDKKINMIAIYTLCNIDNHHFHLNVLTNSSHTLFVTTTHGYLWAQL